MRKIIVSLLALFLIIGIIMSVYLFVKNQQIQESIKDVAESEFVNSEEPINQNELESEIIVNKENGEWNVSGSEEYTVDPDSLSLTFTGYKIGGEHTGTFNSLAGTLSLDAQGQPVMLDLVIDPTTVQTDTEAVDNHLQDDVFFDTAQYPEVTIAVNNITNMTDTSMTLIADVTIKGITKTLRIPATLERTENTTTFALDTKIKISEWDMAFGPVLDDVRVMFEGTIVKN